MEFHVLVGPQYPVDRLHKVIFRMGQEYYDTTVSSVEASNEERKASSRFESKKERKNERRN